METLSRLSVISIHALREEGDLHLNFRCFCFFSISIHALREEGDMLKSWPIMADVNFYPRPPRGGRQSCSYWL